MNSSPEEIIINILYFTDVRDIGMFSLVSKKFAKIFQNESLWRKLSQGRHDRNTFKQMFVLSVFCENEKVGTNTAESFYEEKYIFSSEIVKRVSEHLNFVKKIAFPMYDFYRELCTFTLLEKIDSNLGKITHIPQEIKNLKNLKHLSLCYNHLEDISTLCELEGLITLDVRKNKIKKIPRGMSTLKSLIISENQIDTIPDGFDHLESLIADFCKFTEIPTNIPSIKQLCVRFNKIINITDEITTLGNLKHLLICDEKAKYMSEKTISFINDKNISIDVGIE